MTCQICARPEYEDGGDTAGLCLRDNGLRDMWAVDCYRLGYEREKARADAAEALYADSETARMVARNAELTDALAAARREVEEGKRIMRDCIIAIGASEYEEPEEDGPKALLVMAEAADWIGLGADGLAALAAPAAGEEGTR